MNNYIPTLNDEIKHALINLSFPYSLEFDNNFSTHLEYLGDEIPVTSLSTGESKKADLAVLISMIKIIKNKYPQINLICLDETISSIDPESCIDIIKLLREISMDLFINILIVSHVQLPVEYFDKRIDVFKDGGFSDINFID
jgi:DNA repair exonuclease SbcCD ATPase subunit